MGSNKRIRCTLHKKVKSHIKDNDKTFMNECGAVLFFAKPHNLITQSSEIGVCNLYLSVQILKKL